MRIRHYLAKVLIFGGFSVTGPRITLTNVKEILCVDYSLGDWAKNFIGSMGDIWLFLGCVKRLHPQGPHPNTLSIDGNSDLEHDSWSGHFTHLSGASLGCFLKLQAPPAHDPPIPMAFPWFLGHKVFFPAPGPLHHCSFF